MNWQLGIFLCLIIALDNLLTSLKKEAPRLMPGLPQIQFADRLDKG